MNNSKLVFHILAIATVMIWGITFVSTKMLINYGLTPTIIFIIRFAIAYLCILIVSHNKVFADNISDEFRMMCSGVFGGSLYFISENSALQITFAENVSLIICTAPILTMLLGSIICGDVVKKSAWIGSLIAFAGVGIVIMNGSVNHGINPIGDLLTFMAALSWSIYTLMIKRLSIRYDNRFITRKVFFYGLATASAYSLIIPGNIQFNENDTVAILFNLLFLGVFASCLCYLMWNLAVKHRLCRSIAWRHEIKKSKIVSPCFENKINFRK